MIARIIPKSSSLLIITACLALLVSGCGKNQPTAPTVPTVETGTVEAAALNTIKYKVYNNSAPTPINISYLKQDGTLGFAQTTASVWEKTLQVYDNRFALEAQPDYATKIVRVSLQIYKNGVDYMSTSCEGTDSQLRP